MDLSILQAEARQLGFSLFGITRPVKPQHWDVYSAWVEAGRHASMTYLASENAIRMRAHPEMILENCRSVIVVGMEYGPPAVAQSVESCSLTGRVSSYAYGEDYHQVLKSHLHELATRIAQPISDTSVRLFCDTGAILERELAQNAGLGWIGKNTCLIAPGRGSFFFLGEIFTTLDLPTTPPFLKDRCGSCQRCIQACPTGCILSDRTLDARKCISYLTIENKGVIPLNLRPLMSNWIFGCDICQLVCPWNQRFTRPAILSDFSPHPGFEHPNLLEEILLTSQEFNQKFNNSPIRRTRRVGYLRNVSVALGNLEDRRALPHLKIAMERENNPILREHIQWAMDRLG
jgi:epoxyqueuosine reductase